MSKFGRFASQVKELRIHLCQTGTASKGVRQFINQYYIPIKTENPNVPILVRECSGVQPKLWARFENGKERCAILTDLECTDVKSTLENIVKK